MSQSNVTARSSRKSRSPSKSRSRSSEKILGSTTDDSVQKDKLSTPKFQMVTKSPSPSRRRASAIHLPSSSGLQAVADDRQHRRCRSLKNKRGASRIPHSSSSSQLAPSNIRHSLSGNQLQDLQLMPGCTRSSISHSLSIPSGEDLQDLHLVRNFSLTSKGIVNRGDSFRSKSRSTSICSTPSTPGLSSEEAFPAFSAASCPSSPEGGPSNDVLKYTVWIIGCNGVGKSSIRKQFATSEYICQDDSWQDDNLSKNVMISLDGVETELEIVEFINIDDKVRLKESGPDAYIIMYSVTNRRSYLQARQVLSKLETTFHTRAAILVGNKTDLARLRTVTTLEGRSLAKERGVKFVETSVAINHQVDELLVGVVSQIRIKAKLAEKKKSQRQTQRSKATCIIKRLWRKTCMTSKSCDNLHAL
ncbi:GTP-binding protein REM 1-like [Uloborus diversus]|uniref:GTP-binding protein REM 1-like n=1 Tax=Uloborus diversus TaxID=327109 RepID=UPI0024097EB7|nr:GTP-binding protein REM 1-like [Uloborus diversus]